MIKMKILIDTSVLISGSILWEYSDENKNFLLKHKFFSRCNLFFNFLKMNNELEFGIITKTVEDEAKNALNQAVIRTLQEQERRIPNFVKKLKMMVIQYIITNESLDRLEKIVEECSIRIPIDTKKRDEIKVNEVEPFLKELVKNTVRYIQPPIPGFIKGKDSRAELTDIMLRSLPITGIVYKGMPGDRDLTLMAEATFVYRRYDGKEKIYIASMDNNFKPNPRQIGSFLSGYMSYSGVDSTVRDKLAEKFGFIGEEPYELMNKLKAELPSAKFPEQLTK